MTRALRFLKRPQRLAHLAIIAIGVLEAGCGSPRSKAPDAAGTDAAPDVPAKDVGSPPDVAPADIASDTAVDGGSGTDGGDSGGGADPCYPPCRSRLYGGCPVAGTCMQSGTTFCYSNGVTVYTSPPGSATSQTIKKNGATCATIDISQTFRDPNGVVLGSLTINGDGTATLNCTGEDPVTIPGSCTIPCTFGTCPQ